MSEATKEMVNAVKMSKNRSNRTNMIMQMVCVLRCVNGVNSENHFQYKIIHTSPHIHIHTHDPMASVIIMIIGTTARTIREDIGRPKEIWISYEVH